MLLFNPSVLIHSPMDIQLTNQINGGFAEHCLQPASIRQCTSILAIPSPNYYNFVLMFRNAFQDTDLLF